LNFGFVSHLELQSAFARRISKRLDATVEQKAPAVENNFGHASLLGPLGNNLANARRRIEVCTRFGARILFQRRSRSNCRASRIVDDLRVDMTARTMDRQTRTRATIFANAGPNAPTALFE
jgi:hypothetical protein